MIKMKPFLWLKIWYLFKKCLTLQGNVKRFLRQSRTQSPVLVLWLFGQRVGAKRDSGVLEFQLPQDFCGKTMQPVTG